MLRQTDRQTAVNHSPPTVRLQVSPATQRRIRASLSDLDNEEAIENLSVRQLKEILARNFVNYSGCCEKWELLERVHRLYRENEQNRKSSEGLSDCVQGEFKLLVCLFVCFHFQPTNKLLSPSLPAVENVSITAGKYCYCCCCHDFHITSFRGNRCSLFQDKLICPAVF